MCIHLYTTRIPCNYRGYAANFVRQYQHNLSDQLRDLKKRWSEQITDQLNLQLYITNQLLRTKYDVHSFKLKLPVQKAILQHPCSSESPDVKINQGERTGPRFLHDIGWQTTIEVSFLASIASIKRDKKARQCRNACRKFRKVRYCVTWGHWPPYSRDRYTQLVPSVRIF